MRWRLSAGPRFGQGWSWAARPDRGHPMRSSWKVIVLSATLSTAAAFAPVTLAQQGEAAAASTTTSLVALVYVSSTPKNSSTNEILGFSAASNGKLTPI